MHNCEAIAPPRAQTATEAKPELILVGDYASPPAVKTCQRSSLWRLQTGSNSLVVATEDASALTTPADSRRRGKQRLQASSPAAHFQPKFTPSTRHALTMEEVRGLVKALTKADQPEAIADVLRALAKAPVTVPILHELKCGAVVSKLRKHENESVATEAKLLIKQWKGLAAAAGVPQTAKPPPPPQKTHSFAVDDLGDPTRQAARKKLQATLGEDASDADSYPAAEAVELALHRKWPNLQQPDQKRDYVAKLRQLSFNLKKNSELRSDVNSCAEIKILRRVRAESSRVLHAIDATPARWRGSARSAPLDRTRTAA